MYGGACSSGELFGHVAAFQTGDNVNAGCAEDAGDLLDRDVGVAAQVRHVAAIVLVGENEAGFVPGALERLIHFRCSGDELFFGRHVFKVDGRRVFENSADSFEIRLVMGDCLHKSSLVMRQASPPSS